MIAKMTNIERGKENVDTRLSEVKESSIHGFVEHVKDSSVKVEVEPISKDVILQDFGPVSRYFKTHLKAYDSEGGILEECVMSNLKKSIFFESRGLEKGMSYETRNLLITLQRFFQLRELLPGVEVELLIP